VTFVIATFWICHTQSQEVCLITVKLKMYNFVTLITPANHSLQQSIDNPIFILLRIPSKSNYPNPAAKRPAQYTYEHWNIAPPLPATHSHSSGTCAIILIALQRDLIYPLERNKNYCASSSTTPVLYYGITSC
jgi:hypothetical protein